MFESVQGMLDEHAELQMRLSDPAVHADASLARRLGRRYAQLSGIAEAYHRMQGLEDDLGAAREMAARWVPGFGADEG